MAFHTTRKTREQMAGNWRRVLLSKEKLHVLFVRKVWQIYQIKPDKFIKLSLTNLSFKFDNFIKLSFANLSNEFDKFNQKVSQIYQISFQFFRAISCLSFQRI